MENQEVIRYFNEYVFGFIETDIRREIDLAKNGDAGGNFLTALGLLCYTEFMGTLLLRGKGNSTTRFNAFFKFVGTLYADLFDINKIDVYKVFRCGMAHTYFAQNCDIKMLNNNYPAGIMIQPDGKYLFIVEKYYEDFNHACCRLYNELVGDPSPYLPST